MSIINLLLQRKQAALFATLDLVCILIGSGIIGYQHGWPTGIATLLLAHGCRQAH